MKIAKSLPIAAILALLAPAGWAQSTQSGGAQPAAAPAPQFFHLDFVVKELDGKTVLNSRSYTMELSVGDSHLEHSIRTGSKIPVQTGVSQFQYIDVGVNIDCRRPHVQGDQLAAEVTAEISSVADTSKIGGSEEPVIRQNRWYSDVLMPIGRSAVLFTSDDVTSKHTMELEVTATPVH